MQYALISVWLLNSHARYAPVWLTLVACAVANPGVGVGVGKLIGVYGDLYGITSTQLRSFVC